jgi:uncharacterized membrane protein (DUF2068 family)
VTGKEKGEKMKRLTSIPVGVLLIAGFYIFGAAVLVILFIANASNAASQIATRHGLPAVTGNWILLAAACLGILIGTGLLSLSRWGYVFTIAYLGYFLAVNLYQSKGELATISFGNVVFAAVVIIYLFLVRRRFFPERSPR